MQDDVPFNSQAHYGVSFNPLRVQQTQGISHALQAFFQLRVSHAPRQSPRPRGCRTYRDTHADSQAVGLPCVKGVIISHGKNTSRIFIRI